IQMLDGRHHAKIAHEQRVLHHQRLNIPILHVDHRLRACVETDHFYLPTSQTEIAQRFGHGNSWRFTGAENAVYLTPEAVEKVLRRLISQLARGPSVLIGRDELYVRKLLEGIEKTILTRLRAGGADGVA